MFVVGLLHWIPLDWNWPEDSVSSTQALLHSGSSASSQIPWQSSCFNSVFSSVSSEVDLSMLDEAEPSGLVLWTLWIMLRFDVCVDMTEANGCWFTRLVRTFLKPTATSNICRLSAAATMRLTLCFPWGSLPVYTMSSRHPNSCEETTAVSMEMVSEPSRRDLTDITTVLQFEVPNNKSNWFHGNTHNSKKQSLPTFFKL